MWNKRKVGGKQGRMEEEMKIEGGERRQEWKAQQELLQVLAEEKRNISPSHCGPSTCLCSSFIISPGSKEGNNV